MYCVECGWFFEKNCMYVIYWVVCGWVSGVGDMGNFGWYVGGYLDGVCAWKTLKKTNVGRSAAEGQRSSLFSVKSG